MWVTPEFWPAIIACPKSMYGAASLMKRLPSPLTMNCAGIIRSLSMNCIRPSGHWIAGNHQASSSRSVAAPTFWPARMPSPMAAGLPKLQSWDPALSKTGSCSFRQARSCSKPPEARITLARNDPLLGACSVHNCTDHRAVRVDEQLGHRRVQPQRDIAFFHRQAQPSHQRLADCRYPLSNTLALTIREISFSRTPFPAHDCLMR